MFPRSDFSTTRLVVQTTALLLFAGGFTYILYRSDKEAMRLLRIIKFYGYKTIEDEEEELAKIKRRLVIGYTIFLVLSIVAAVVYGYALLNRLFGGT